MALCDGLSLEVSYLGIEDAEITSALGRDPLALTTLFSPYLSLGSNATDFTFVYNSELHSGEANLRHELTRGCGCWNVALLCGLRYIRLKEDFRLTGTDPLLNAPLVTTEETAVRTTNDLFGVQIGGEATHWLNDRWGLGVRLKAGFLLNNVESRVTNFINPGLAGGPPELRLDTLNNEDTFATSLDAGIHLSYRCWGDRLILRGGYEVLAITGLALAPEQLLTTHNEIQRGTIASGRTGVNLDDSGSILYHGPSLGLELNW